MNCQFGRIIRILRRFFFFFFFLGGGGGQVDLIVKFPPPPFLALYNDQYQYCFFIGIAGQQLKLTFLVHLPPGGV